MEDDNAKPANRPRRVTAQAVADAAGVSRSAVSRAFTPGAYLDADKRTKIHNMAARMGYQPNALAAGLKGGRSHLVAVFVGNMRSTYDSEFVNRLVGQLNALNKWPILIDGGDDRAEAAIDQVMRYPLDALILRGGSMPGALVEQCSKFGVPMISSGRIVDAPRVDNVCCRNAEGMRIATQALIDRGRKRFGFIAGAECFASSADRRAGLIKALDQAGLPLIAEEAGEFTVEAGYDASMTLLPGNRLDALVCANDASAIGALTAARELGLDVPGALSIVGFDDIEMAGWPTFNLSTVNNPIDEAVEHVIHLLERRLSEPGRPSETLLIDPYFVPRGTH
ncbi:LacI family DNA-binding transcriptional regulator [Ruegeria arenilitoris]|uniref:LacI family DNA-binding transcriptional regulator n=1 Tax=Ruegeria arenilitoris TaxID=1173585 RepID=UPI00147AAB27